MQPVTISEVESVLTTRLGLHDPIFKLEPAGTKVSGSVISSTFRGMRDLERQRKIWDALDAEYGVESNERVGSLLAFTPDEWNIDDI
jgi:acid stress-induced BolA-like protein IbaG/YrbA